jgi:hypothetical protein
MTEYTTERIRFAILDDAVNRTLRPFDRADARQAAGEAFDRWRAEQDAEAFLLGLRRARDAAYQPYPGLGWESSVEKIDAVIAACENMPPGGEA